jgi:hypothetical protein
LGGNFDFGSGASLQRHADHVRITPDSREAHRERFKSDQRSALSSRDEKLPYKRRDDREVLRNPHQTILDAPPIKVAKNRSE